MNDRLLKSLLGFYSLVGCRGDVHGLAAGVAWHMQLAADQAACWELAAWYTRDAGSWQHGTRGMLGAAVSYCIATMPQPQRRQYGSGRIGMQCKSECECK
jgi:hypothetical protein